MEEKKELCGKNVYFLFQETKVLIYGNERKTGEIILNQNKNISEIKLYNKKYAQNLVYFINLHKEITIDSLDGFPTKQFYLDQIKERLHPDILLKAAIKSKSTKLVKYALEREAFLNEETLVDAAAYCSSILLLNMNQNFNSYENAMEAAFKNKNNKSVKVLVKKIKNLDKYINWCNEGKNYDLIKKIFIKEMVRRHNLDKKPQDSKIEGHDGKHKAG